MRLAIDVRCLIEGRHSGVEEYTIQLIRAFQRVAPQHQYIFFYNAAKKIRLPELGNGKIVAFRYPNKIFNAVQWSVGWPQWDKLVTADCFFVPSLRLLPLKVSTPLVTTVHDLSFERFPEFLSLKRRIWHRLMKPRTLMSESDHLIAVSEATAGDVSDLYGISQAKISVIHSGVADILQPSTKEARNHVSDKYQLPSKFILYCGTLEPRKNIPSIVRAFSAIAGSVPQDLVIAGSTGWLTKELELTIKESPYNARIHKIGFIDEADKHNLYALADLFVYPSFYEGFGFPPLESLLAGTPVVTSMNSSLPEIVGNWATLIDPYNTSELALVLKELLRDLPIVHGIVQEEIKEMFNWDKAAVQTLQVIESVL